MKRLLAALLLALAVPSLTFGVTCTFSSDGNWSGGGSCAGNPTNANDCVINADVDVLMDSSAGVCGSLTVTAAGNLIYKEGARSLTIGDGLAAGTSDNTSIAGSVQMGAGQSFLVNTANTTGATRGTITVTGYLSATGRTLMSNGVITAVGTMATGNWPDRAVVLTTSPITYTITDATTGMQTATNSLVGKVFVANTGYFRQAWFDITANTANTITLRVDGSAAAGTHRGQVDSRNQEGREDPAATWAPGDWGETIDGGTNAAPATATVANGGTTVTVSGAWPGGTARMSQFVGGRFICAADIGAAANDPDVRIIESITDTTHFELKTTYGTASCAAGGDYRILVDNQPPIPALVTEAFGAGDTYDIIDPATIGIPAASWSDSTQTAQIGAINLTNGGTLILKNTSVGNCGNYISGASAQGCLKVDDIDNSNSDEGLYLDRVEFHHYNGIAAVDLEDCANITMRRLSIRDAAEGGNATTVAAGTCPSDEAHGIRINDNAGDGRVSGIVIEDSRIVRTNDVSYSPFTAAESDEINCTDCRVSNVFMGFNPNSCGGSTQCMGLAEGVTRFAADHVFCTNAPAGGYVGVNIGTNTNALSGYVVNSLFQNMISGWGVNTATDATGTTDANTQFYFVNNVWRNIGSIVLQSPMFTRGRFIDNFFDPANKGGLASGGNVQNFKGIISEPQEGRGNIALLPPNMAVTAGTMAGLFWHEPTGTARIEPTTLYEWDNAIFGPTSVFSTGDAYYIGGLHGSGNDALASILDARHNTFVGTQHLAPAGGFLGWRMRDNGSKTHTIKDNVFTNMFASYTRINGSEVVTGDYNLCTKIGAGLCPAGGMSSGANDLTTGMPGLFDPQSGDFNVRAGSTPKESLGSDGYLRGVRVAGPTNWSVFKTLYPYISPRPIVNNISDRDTDGDGVWDVLDNCDSNFNPAQIDTDGDGAGDCCDGGTCF